jgi:hypothetical protein
MTRSVKRFGVVFVAILIVLTVVIAASAAAKPKITLTAAKSSCKVGDTVKVSATVTGADAYEVRIYKKVGSSWQKAVTATRVSPGHYVAYVKATAKGTMQLKAGYVNSSGSVTAWSNVVSIKVKG